jgi:hypothetical protein
LLCSLFHSPVTASLLGRYMNRKLKSVHGNCVGKCALARAWNRG